MSVECSGPPAWPDVGVRFMVDADSSPGLLPRLLQPFAKRDLTPDRMWSHRDAAVAHVEIALGAVAPELVGLLDANLRQVVGVHGVAVVRRAEICRAA